MLSQIVQESVSSPEIYQAMDSFLTESNNIDGTPYRRSIDRLNLDRSLFVEKMNSILISSQISLLEAELERKKGIIKCDTRECYKDHNCNLERFKDEAIQEDITYLTEQIELIKKMV